jgi:Contractile injection system tape measure protein
VTSVQHHIIRRQFLEIELAGTESDGLALQRRLTDLCGDWLGPALESAFDRSVRGDEHWTIDRLEIDAGSCVLETFERDFVSAVAEAVARQLNERAAGLGGSLERKAGDTAAQADSQTMERSRESALQGSADSGGLIQRRTDLEALHDAFLYFLATGTLPWWFRLPAGHTLEDTIAESWQTAGLPPHRGQAVVAAIASVAMRTRLVRQFSATFLQTLLGSVSPEGARAIAQVIAEMALHGFTRDAFPQLAEQLWQLAFIEAAAGRRVTAETLIDGWLQALPPTQGQEERGLLARIRQRGSAEQRSPPADESGPAERAGARSDTPALARSPPAADMPGPAERAGSPGPDTRASGIHLEEGIFVECAGLVLLHPFLPRLFETLHIAKDGSLVQPERALCLMHFLATGERRAPEYALVVPKILCNLPLEEPVAAPVELTVEEEDEAATLLQAVIHHWDALGNTSVDGLRGTFLVRAGKLSRRGDDDVLQVEPRSFDILLDKLPWGLGAIQLPWMKKILWVEWTS